MNGNPKEKQVEIEHKEEERLSPPPKVLVDAKNRRGKDSTLKKLRYSNLVLCIYSLIKSINIKWNFDLLCA